mmetsp:Transcript_17777/g.26262  ORF Transcript_17777/g.26262 Transcript_17777/m.26262 type:complete len:211 (-) Transcript_17777:650-1282(-)
MDTENIVRKTAPKRGSVDNGCVSEGEEPSSSTSTYGSSPKRLKTQKQECEGLDGQDDCQTDGALSCDLNNARDSCTYDMTDTGDETGADTEDNGRVLYVPINSIADGSTGSAIETDSNNETHVSLSNRSNSPTMSDSGNNTDSEEINMIDVAQHNYAHAHQFFGRVDPDLLDAIDLVVLFTATNGGSEDGSVTSGTSNTSNSGGSDNISS